MQLLSELCEVQYGTKLDLNKLEVSDDPDHGILFVSRSSKNNGVSSIVKQVPGVSPLEAGLITVALGGTKLLSSFVQERSFYTAQNVAVLRPRTNLSFNQLIFLCVCIRKNRFKYSAFGREANRTLGNLLLPSPEDFPPLRTQEAGEIDRLLAPFKAASISMGDPSAWTKFRFSQLFDIERGRGPRKHSLGAGGKTPFVTSSDAFNGVSGTTDCAPTHPGNTLGVNRNGSVGEAFYQPVAYCSTEDVHIFHPKFDLTPLRGLFLITLIRRERYRFGYGRKWGLKRMLESEIRLPTDTFGNPDWEFVDTWMGSLPFSREAAS